MSCTAVKGVHAVTTSHKHESTSSCIRTSVLSDPLFSTTSGKGSHRLGFDSISDGYTSTGRWFPSDTVGHLGYTGTSLWISPFRRTVVALLTNRVPPVDRKKAIRKARPRIHDAVATSLGWDKTSA